MTTTKLSSGTAHTLPDDLRRAFMDAPKARAAWEDITPLARNEWICWIVSVKTSETRANHVSRAIKELAEGKRRPCCWMGCIHRKDKPMSPSQKFILKNC